MKSLINENYLLLREIYKIFYFKFFERMKFYNKTEQQAIGVIECAFKFFRKSIRKSIFELVP